MNKKYCIAVHGGAGTMSKNLMTAEMESVYNAALKKALQAGYAILSTGGKAVDAVEAAVIELENCDRFNAGKGSVFTHEGKHEMDAAIMDGKNLESGAVAGVRNIKNPVALAKKVMLESEHVLLVNDGAETFAKLQNIPFEDDNYFFTQHRYDQYISAKNKNIVLLDHSEDQPGNRKKEKNLGTVGSVALDADGNLAAATSTGGMTNKFYGRVGDSPIIGAGTYANNRTCAVSCTGHGEYFIKHVVAYDISCLIEYKNYSLKEACDLLIYTKLKNDGGDGGLIAIDNEGNICLPFNSEGMYRGSMTHEGNIFTAIF